MIRIWTDASVKGRSGIGIVIVNTQVQGKKRRKQIAVSLVKKRTSMHTELVAIAYALQLFDKPQSMRIYTDNKLIADIANRVYEPRQNIDLWATVRSLMEVHDVAIEWIPRNSDENARNADKMARLGAAGVKVDRYV